MSEWKDIDNDPPPKDTLIWLYEKTDSHEWIVVGSWSNDLDGWWWNAATMDVKWSKKYGWDVEQ